MRDIGRKRRMPIIWLFIAAVGLLASFAAVFEIDQTVRAQGQVIPGLRTQVVQAVDGGALSAIHVREGDHVRKGQKLAELEADRAAAGASQSLAEVASKRIALARARAELSGTDPSFDQAAQAYPGFVAAQRGVFLQRKRSLDEEMSVLTQALNLAQDELGMTERLYASGDISRGEVMRAQRQVLELQARINGARNKYLHEARLEVAKLEDELSTSRFRYDERQSVLAHTDLTAPTDGVVKYIRINTIGGVLRPGDELMQISPVDDELLVDIKINPSDIGLIKTGLPVALRFDAFDSSLYGVVHGTLRYVSPDTLSEQGPTGQQMTYYRAQVVLEWLATKEQPANRLDARDIKPGMTATADVLVGQRTILYYLMKPIIRGFSGALTQR